MAKITAHGGPSDVNNPDISDDPPYSKWSDDHLQKALKGLQATAAEIIEEIDARAERGQSSPGTSSSASTGKSALNTEKNESDDPKPARMMGSLFGKDRTASSTAPTTAGKKGSGSTDKSPGPAA